MTGFSKDPGIGFMYKSALIDLRNGVLNQMDKEILSYNPLPDDAIAPYVSQNMEPRAAMEMTYASLTAWIEEAKKASYFTKHFVTLSKMINSGVASMARGLVTLHERGEDLAQAPMSIQDLIGVSSYHIRKSHLGVLQTSRSHPEIGERLVLNQLSWTNTLLRLFKTRDKLAAPVPVHKASVTVDQLPADENKDVIAEFEALEDTPLLPLGCAQAISEPAALSEPGAFKAVRAFSGYLGNKKSEIRNKKSLCAAEDFRNMEALLADEGQLDEFDLPAAELSADKGLQTEDSVKSEPEQHTQNEAPVSANRISRDQETEAQTVVRKENSETIPNRENGSQAEKKPETNWTAQDQETVSEQENGSQTENLTKTNRSFPEQKPAYPDDKPPSPETIISGQKSAHTAEGVHLDEVKFTNQRDGRDGPEGPTRPVQLDETEFTNQSPGLPEEDPPSTEAISKSGICARDEDHPLSDRSVPETESGPPGKDPPTDYHEILARAAERITKNDHEKYAFTIDEIEALLNDPVFCEDNPILELELLEEHALRCHIISPDDPYDFF